MADGFVQVFPDSIGKQIDTDAITDGSNVLHRQRIRLGGANRDDLATVTNNRLDVNVGNTATVEATNFDIRDLNSSQDSVEALQSTHDNLNLNANLQVGDSDVDDGNPIPISDGNSQITIDYDPGTEADTASDPSGDGVVTIGGASFTTLNTITVGSGVTLYITGLMATTDKQATFNLVVQDSGVDTQILRAFPVIDQPINWNYNRAIEVVGQAGRTVILRAQKATGGSANASGAINAYTKP